jgi:hypothetical protein
MNEKIPADLFTIGKNLAHLLRDREHLKAIIALKEGPHWRLYIYMPTGGFWAPEVSKAFFDEIYPTVGNLSVCVFTRTAQALEEAISQYKMFGATTAEYVIFLLDHKIEAPDTPTVPPTPPDLPEGVRCQVQFFDNWGVLPTGQPWVFSTLEELLRHRAAREFAKLVLKEAKEAELTSEQQCTVSEAITSLFDEASVILERHLSWNKEQKS